MQQHRNFSWVSNGKARESLLKGKDQNGSPPCSNQFRLTPFETENTYFFFYKTAYLNEEVNHTELSIQLVFPEKSSQNYIQL